MRKALSAPSVSAQPSYLNDVNNPNKIVFLRIFGFQYIQKKFNTLIGFEKFSGYGTLWARKEKTKSSDIPVVINSITKIRRLLCKLCKYETQPLLSYTRNEIFNDVDIFNYHQSSELTPKWDQHYYRISADSGGHFESHQTLSNMYVSAVFENLKQWILKREIFKVTKQIN